MKIIGAIICVVGALCVYSYFENKSKKKSKDPIIIGLVAILIGGILVYEEKCKEERIEELNRQAEEYRNNQYNHGENLHFGGLNDYRYRCERTGCWCKVTRSELENRRTCPKCGHPTREHK